jgi:NADH dehydrogenase FAD-containing subunit
VTLRLGQPLERGREAEALGVAGPSVVLSCAGVRMRNAFAGGLNCLDERGCIRINHRLEVLCPGPQELQPVAGGRVFALGDCASVQDASPLPREIYPAEASAGIIIANLRAAKTPGGPVCQPLTRSELKLPLNHFCICSLGPDDAVFVANGYVCLTGLAATFMKNQIESSKMSEYRNHVWGNLVWSLVPHW